MKKLVLSMELVVIVVVVVTVETMKAANAMKAMNVCVRRVDGRMIGSIDLYIIK